MKRLIKINQEKYDELYDAGIIDRIYPEDGLSINQTLYNMFSKSNYIYDYFDLPYHGPYSKRYNIYNYMRTYEIDLDKFVDNDEDDIRFLKIAFFTSYTSVEQFDVDLKEYYINASNLMFLINPRLYSPCYYPNINYYDRGFLTSGRVIKYTNNYSENQFLDAIYKLDNYVLEKTGEHLLFRFKKLD